MQTISNLCVALAALVMLLPLPRLLSRFARQYPNDNRWMRSALFVLIPLWMFLAVGLLGATASGAFDWLPLGRAAHSTFMVAASLALGFVTFAALGSYIRPGITPRRLYLPVIYLVPLATGLVALLGLNPNLGDHIPLQWLRVPWALFAALSFVLGVGLAGHQFVKTGFGVRNVIRRLLTPRISESEQVASIPTFDLNTEDGFTKMLGLSNRLHSRKIRAAATARLRGQPDFLDRLVGALANSRGTTTALEFIEGADLTAEEQQRLARPVRKALETFIKDIPAPNYIMRSQQRALLKFGRGSFPRIIGKFAGTDVDYSRIMPAFEHALRPDDTRR